MPVRDDLVDLLGPLGDGLSSPHARTAATVLWAPLQCPQRIAIARNVVVRVRRISGEVAIREAGTVMLCVSAEVANDRHVVTLAVDGRCHS